MSSTSNAQDLLVNVFRPTYRWDSNTGFVPSLVISNVTEVITESVRTDRLAVSDSNLNTYIGSNAGANATGTASNVALGYSAMGGALNSSNNVAVGMFSLDGLSNSDCNVALGARTDITGQGTQNVLIGPNVTMGTGNKNILIGVDISAGNVSNRFQLGTLLYGDLSSGFLGVNNTAPTRAFDVSGITVFRGKVGFQNDNPVYSLDVNGSIGVSERFLGSNGSETVPLYSFSSSNASNSGLYVPTDASYGLGAIGVSVGGLTEMVIASNKTYIYNGLDVCGTVSASGGSASFLAGRGSATEPAYSFLGASNLGLYRTTDASGSAVGIAVGATSRFVVGSNKVTILGNMDVCGSFSAVSGGGGGGGTVATNGSAAAPSFTFSNDSTTGLFLQSASNLGFATGGVRRMAILDTGDVSAGQLVVAGYLRNTTNGSRTLDISSGNISNSGTTTSTNALVSGYLRNALTPTTWDISGGNFSNSNSIQTGNPADKNLYATIEIGKGYSDIGTGGTPAASFQYNGGGFRHFIRSRHTTSLSSGNAIDFYLNTSGTSTTSTAPETGNILGCTITGTGVGIGRTPVTTIALDVSGATQIQRVVTGNLNFIRLADSIANSTTPPTRIGLAIYNQATGSGNGGGDFAINAYDDSSVILSTPLLIKRSNGNVGIANVAPAYQLDVTGQGHFQNASSNSGSVLLGDPTTGMILQRDQPGNGYVRAQASANLYLGTSNSNWMTITNAGAVGIGVGAPVATLDICGQPGTPSLNLATWPRIPLSNCLMVKGIPASAMVGNTLNFNTVVRTINSALGTFVASNGTSGGSLLINKAGIWSITLAGSTGNGTNLWMDVSTGNHSNIGVYTNGNPVLAAGYSPGVGTSNVATASFTGFLPSNIYVKARINGALGADGDVVWRLNAIFQAETDAVTTWPF